MKLSVIITTILAVQVSASFFDVFHGAVLSVQNSFGKLLSDVVTDVKETVDCTILAVEYVLSLSNDATTRYYETCGSVTNQTDSVSETLQDATSAPKLEITLNLPNNSEYLQKMRPAEINARIYETLSKARGNYKSHDNVLSIENVLAKESEQLAGVSVLVKKELDKLPHEVTTDLKKIGKERDSEPSVDTILQEIKVLEKREQNTKNSSKASEIHQVIDQVLGKLNAIEATKANENSSNSFMGLRQQFEEWKESRHLSEIKSKIEEHENFFDPGSFNRHGFESPTTFRSSEVATLPTNQSTTLQYNLTINNTNESVNTPVSVSVKPEETGTTSDNEKSSTVTTKIVNYNDSNNTIITAVSLPIVENTSVSGTVQPKETTAVSGNEDFLKDSNGTMISTSFPIIESTLINKTIQPDETKIKKTASSNKECSTVATSELTTTSKIVNEKNSDTTITSTPNVIISKPESEAIQAIDTPTVSTSDEESLGSIADSPTGTHDDEHDHDGTDDDDSSVAVVTMTPGAISESIPQKIVTVAENYETLASTTNSPIASPATLIDTDSNIDAFPSAEITTVSEVIEAVKSTVPTENVKPSVLSTTPVTIPDEVTDKNTDTIETVTITTRNAGSPVVTEIIQTDEISTASEEQELSSTSITTQSAIIVTTSTVIPPTERIPTSGSITASRNEEDLKNSPTLKANTSRSPEILYSPDLNVRTPPLTITKSVLVNREWLTSNTPKLQNYNKNEAPRNNYEFNAPISLSDPLLQTAQPLTNPEVPMYGQAVPLITRSLFNGAPKLLTPDRLIPNAPNQQPKIENIELPQTAFEFFDTADKQLSHSNSPFGPEEDIKKIANVPSPPLITNAPRKSIDPQRINYDNPSYVPTPKYPIDLPYSFDNRAPPNTYRPRLTTERPKKTAGRANNYKSPPMDYDSFLHTPPRNSEAHQRALKEARQLMANSKRAERIIKNIMKNRNKFNARSVFG